MAFYYQDLNGVTPGFGTLTNSMAGGQTIASCSTSNLGTVATAAISFSSANQHELSFGSAATNNGTPGTFTLAANLSAPFFNGLTFQNLTGNQSFVYGGTVTNFTTACITMVGTNPYIDVSATGKLILDVTVSGSVNWRKLGASALQLLRANNFSSGMTIVAGTVEIGNASALGTGTVTMTGGKLSSSSTTGYTVANAFSLNGTVVLCDATNNGLLTLSGALTIAGTTSLSIPANYVLGQGVFGGTGAFTLSLGELDLEGLTGTKSGGTTISGGTLYLGFGESASDQLGTDALTINSGSVFFCGSGNTSATNTITGSGGVLYARPRNATITFSGAGAYAGVARIYAGASDGAGTLTQGMTFSTFPAVSDFSFVNQNSAAASNTQTIKYTGTASVTSAASISISPTVATTSVWHHAPSNGTGTMSISGVVASDTTVAHTFRITNDSSGLLAFTNGIDQRNSGVLTLVKTGTGPATVSGTGTYLGSVTVSAGTFNANSATALGLAISTAAISVTSGATLSLGAAATYTSRSLSVAGNGSASAPNNGALIVNHALTSTFFEIAFTGPTYIRATASGGLDSRWAPANNSLILGAASGVTFTPFVSGSLPAKTFSGTGSVTYGQNSLDTGTILANVRHTYTGNTTLAYGTVSVYSSQENQPESGPLGDVPLTSANTLLMTGAILSYFDGTVDYSGRFGSGGNQQWKIATDRPVTFASNLVGASSLSLYAGAGALTLSGNNTFSLGVNLIGSTLVLGSAENPGFTGPLGQTGAVIFTGGTLQYTSVNQFDYSSRFSTAASQQWKIDTNGQNVTFASALSSVGGSLAKSGAGVLTLSAANSYNAGTTLAAGTLKSTDATALGTGGLAQANGTTLHVATSDGKMTIQGAHTNTGSGSRTIRIGA